MDSELWSCTYRNDDQQIKESMIINARKHDHCNSEKMIKIGSKRWSWYLYNLSTELRHWSERTDPFELYVSDFYTGIDDQEKAISSFDWTNRVEIIQLMKSLPFFSSLIVDNTLWGNERKHDHDCWIAHHWDRFFHRSVFSISILSLAPSLSAFGRKLAWKYHASGV